MMWKYCRECPFNLSSACGDITTRLTTENQRWTWQPFIFLTLPQAIPLTAVPERRMSSYLLRHTSRPWIYLPFKCWRDDEYAASSCETGTSHCSWRVPYPAQAQCHRTKKIKKIKNKINKKINHILKFWLTCKQIQGFLSDRSKLWLEQQKHIEIRIIYCAQAALEHSNMQQKVAWMLSKQTLWESKASQGNEHLSHIYGRRTILCRRQTDQNRFFWSTQPLEGWHELTTQWTERIRFWVRIKDTAEQFAQCQALLGG